MLPLVLGLVLAAAPADVARCQQALKKVTSHEATERLDAFQVCGALFTDARLRVAWYGVVHTSPFDAAAILALAVGEPNPSGPNACARSKSTLDICGSDRAVVERLPPALRASEWRTVFMRLLEVDFPAPQADALHQAFAEKWGVMFPEAPPPQVSNDGPLKVSGNINRLEVLRALGAVRPELNRCLASPEQELTLRWTVEQGGKVSGFAVLAPSEAARVACLTRAFKPVKMPVPGGGGAAILVWTPEPP